MGTTQSHHNYTLPFEYSNIPNFEQVEDEIQGQEDQRHPETTADIPPNDNEVKDLTPQSTPDTPAS